MHRPGNRILPGLRPAARPYGVTAPAPLAPILDGPTAGWHLAFAERLRGPLDVAALRTAWDTVTAHQDALRYRVSDCAGIVQPAGAVPLPVEDVSDGMDVEDAGDGLTDRLAALAGAGFDPADRLWRLGLYRLAPDDHVLAFAGHRAVFDVRAQALLYADLARAYRDARAGRPPELAPLRVVFADYVAWRGWQVNRRGQADLAWWTAHLDGVASRLELPADVPADAAPRTARPLRTGHSTVDAPLAAGVGALARSLGATPAAVVLAALGTVLARLTGQADFVVGTPLAGRRPPGFEPLVGSLCDIAPLRLRPDPATGFAVQVRRTRDELLDALAHAGTGLGQVVGALRPAPPVQVLFELVEEPPPALDLVGLATGPVPVPAPTPVDLSLRCVPDGDRLRLDAAYDTDRFTPARIAAFLATLCHVLDQAVTSPDRALGEFALRPDDQPVPQRDETVLDGLGRRAAIGELGEIAAHWAGGWLGTGRTGRYRPDGTVEPAPVPTVRPAVSPEPAPGAGARSRPA